MRFLVTASQALAVAAAAAPPASAQNAYEGYADSALQQLQTFYDNSTGLWHSYGVSWWQSANALTTLANMVSLGSPTAKAVADFVIPNTFTEAQAFNLQHNHHTKRDQTSPWTNGFYDDEGWWAMAWIRAYDVTNNTNYLDAAEGLFQDMTGGWGTNCSANGLWWDKSHTQIAAISNVLFLEVAAYLANRVPAARKANYVTWAEREWAYLQSSGVYDAQRHLVLGGVNLQTCATEVNSTGYTYSQGTLIEGLTELAVATGNHSYVAVAEQIAAAVMQTMTKDGVLTEMHINPANPGDSVPQFKGVFMRGLMRLQASSPSATYVNFGKTNAQSIWDHDRQGNAFGFTWTGPYGGPPNASLQSSAMDALVMAWSATV